MRIVATPRTAALVGLWTALGGTLYESCGRQYEPHNVFYGVVFLVAFTPPFFFVPVALFVIGPDTLRRVSEGMKAPRQTTWESMQTMRRDWRPVWMDAFMPYLARLLSWFAAGGAGTLLYSLLHHLSESRVIK